MDEDIHKCDQASVSGELAIEHIQLATFGEQEIGRWEPNGLQPAQGGRLLPLVIYAHPGPQCTLAVVAGVDRSYQH